MATYLYTTLKDNIIDSNLYTNFISSTVVRNGINRGIRKVISDIDLRSTKRKATAIRVFDDIYDYTCPTDLKSRKLVDIVTQANRSPNTRLSLVDESTFDRKKTIYNNLVAFTDRDLTRKIKTTINTKDEYETISEFSSLTQGAGTWTVFGDAENLAVNDTRSVDGGNSLEFDISDAGGTTAGAYISGITDIDITNYAVDGSLFVWVYITSTTNLTNYILRIGNDSSNYYYMTVTTTNEGLSFQNGWNLLRFDFSGKTETGTVDEEAIDYITLYMTKDAAKVSETGYRFDKMTLHNGEYHSVIYYSKYGWQNSDATWIENSTADTDYVNADTEELELFTEKCKEELFRDLKDYDQMNLARQNYELLKQNYKSNYPSEAVKMEQYYY